MTERDLQTIKVPLNEFVRELAREAAREMALILLREHEKTCLARRVAGRMIFFCGVVVGSGVLGGGIGAFLMKVL